MDHTGNSEPHTIDSSRFMESVRMFQEMTSSLAGTFELQPFLEQVIKSYKHLSKASRCAIFLVNEERDKLIMRANEGYKVTTMQEYDYNVDNDAPGIGLTTWVAKKKQVFSAKSFDEIKEHPAWLGRYDTLECSEGDKCTSLIIVPLIVKTESLGVIKAENKISTPQHPESYFSEQDEHDLQAIANIIAVAIESLTNKKKNSDKDDFINAIAKLFIYYKGGSSLYKILDSIVIWIRDVCDATGCSIFLKNRSGTQLVMRASIGFDVDLKDEANYDIKTAQLDKNEGLTVRIFKNRENIYATNREELEKQPGFLAKYEDKYLKGKKVVSFIGLPLIVCGEVLGVLKTEMAVKNEDVSSSYSKLKYFSRETNQMLEILSNIVAILVYNSYLRSREKEYLKCIINLYEIGNKIYNENNGNKRLYLFLLGLTHGHVISFNRAICFEYDSLFEQLHGRMALGSINNKTGKKMRGELERINGDYPIEDAIENYDKGNFGLSKALNKLVKVKSFDLLKINICNEHIKSNDISKKYNIEEIESKCSPQLITFLRKREMRQFTLIGIKSARNKWFFVFCDNNYDFKDIDEPRERYLGVFTGQMAKALEHFNSKEREEHAGNLAKIEAYRSTVHLFGNRIVTLNADFRILKNTLVMTEDNQEILERMEKDIAMLKEILDRFKDKSTKSMWTGNINLLLSNVCKFCDRDYKRITFDFNYVKVDSYNTTIPEVQVNLNEIISNIYELINNTLDATTNSPTVNITLTAMRVDSNYVKIVYEDNGPGIEYDKKEEVFKKYSTKSKNRGLGLAILKKTIEDHGGYVSEDGEPGKGVRFNLLLPIYGQQSLMEV